MEGKLVLCEGTRKVGSRKLRVKWMAPCWPCRWFKARVTVPSRHLSQRYKYTHTYTHIIKKRHLLN